MLPIEYRRAAAGLDHPQQGARDTRLATARLADNAQGMAALQFEADFLRRLQ